MEYDDYEVAELVAEARQQRINNRYYDYRDPEYQYNEEGDDDE